MSLVQSKASIIVENVFTLLHLVTKYSKERAPLIKDVALSSGILIHHFYNSVFSSLEGQRMLSRSFCALWFSGPSDSIEKLLMKRIIPGGFMTYLAMPILSDIGENTIHMSVIMFTVNSKNNFSHYCVFRNTEEEQLDEIERGNLRELDQNQNFDLSCGAGTNKSRLRQRLKILSCDDDNIYKNSSKMNENFRIFFHVLAEDHSLPDLIWNENTRQELKNALKAELISIQQETRARGGIDKVSWNYNQFRVDYMCLRNEMKVGTIYMRLWLETGDSFIKSWSDPTNLFELLFRRLLCDIDHDDIGTNMCIRCIERLYSVHAQKIGVFHDLIIVVRLMRNSKNVETSQRLLNFLSTLIGCSNASEDQDCTSFIGNAEQLLNEECISYLCQFVAWAHTEIERNPSAKLQNEFLSPTSAPEVWFLAPAGTKPLSSEGVLGPFNLGKLRELVEKGDITPHSLVNQISCNDYCDIVEKSHDCWKMRINHAKWTRVEDLLQLKWLLLTDPSSMVYNPSEVCLIALKCLDRLVSIHKSIDSRGTPFFPIPIAKSLICESRLSPDDSSEKNQKNNERPLSIICQALLCNDPRIVNSAGKLIMKLISYNPKACSSLYRTGVFFFALLLDGSELESVMALVHETHLKQQSDSVISDDSPMEDYIFMDCILPKGVVNVLKQTDVQSFCKIFVGNIDSPEVIWSPTMR